MGIGLAVGFCQVTVPRSVSPGSTVVLSSTSGEEITSCACVTETAAIADLEGSATLVATTWNVPAVAGAVYTPAALMLPPPGSCTDQVTAPDCPAAVPVTDVWKLIVPPTVIEGVGGVTVTPIGCTTVKT